MPFILCSDAADAVGRFTGDAFMLEEDAAGVFLVRSVTGERVQLLLPLPPAYDRRHIESLSDRERQVFEMLGEGQDMSDIAACMALSVKTVETYRARIKQKLKIDKRSQLLRMAVDWSAHRKAESLLLTGPSAGG